MTNPISTEDMRKIVVKAHDDEWTVRPFIAEMADALTQAADELDRLRKNQILLGTVLRCAHCEADPKNVRNCRIPVEDCPLRTPPTDIGER